MAVQAQYRSNLLLFNNNDADEHHENNNNQQLPPLFFSANGNSTTKIVNKKKKRRSGGDQVPAQHPAFSLQSPQPPVPSMISLSPFDNPTSSSSIDNNDILAQINHHHTQQLNHFLHTQGEQLRRTLAEKRQQHLRALLASAEDSAARRLVEKQAEVDRAARRAAELEDRLARLRTESMAWQAKARAEHSAAALLQARIRSAAAWTGPGGGEDGAEDAGSAHVDQDRAGVCRCCRVEPASVVLLPCRHLCLCPGCDAVTAGECCPVCGGARTGGVLVFFS